ncbi:MAG TPA: CpsD/CapB family tyrosine-protein kinase [Candidatus Binataceae bacterium]|nr:CpsD/CapB family tyrosine-protein kinase [Candidatus Binataceae bacterium]
MSNVYKALKRAEREGFWHSESQTEPLAGVEQPARTQSPSADSTTSIRGDSQKAAAQREGANRDEFLRDVRSSRRVLDREVAEASTPGWISKLWRIVAGNEIVGNHEAPSIVIGDENATPAAEKFQLLRVWLQSWTSAAHERVILVCSSLPNEGKSFVSLNLGLALASNGSHVTLVDADLRKPSLYQSFGLSPLTGLYSFLAGRADFKESLTATGLPGLSLVSSQEVAESATELIAGPRMRDFIGRAREMDPEQYILIDASPVLAAPESEILAELADAVLFVVAANHTPRALVKKALGLLGHARKLDVVLNRYEASFTTSRRLGYKYGYGYGEAERDFS